MAKKISIPDSLKEMKEPWKPLKVKLSKALILADCHVPFHSKRNLEIAINYGLAQKCRDVVLLGDFLDSYAISHFERDIELRDFSKEIRLAKEIIAILSSSFQGSKIYIEGNHCARFGKFLVKQAPELLNLEELSFKNLLGLEDWLFVDKKRPIKSKDFFLLHGDQISASGRNKAQGIYNKTKSNCIIGHYHKTSQYSETGMDGKEVTCYSLGCLSQLNPLYNPCHNQYNSGFAILDNITGKEEILSNYRIEKGRILI